MTAERGFFRCVEWGDPDGGFRSEESYEVGDTFEWAGGATTRRPATRWAYGTYRITRKTEDSCGENWYEAELMPENPMSEEDMREIST